MKNQLIRGTIILTIAGFVTRVIGFVYRIFLSNVLGEVNLGIYQLIFPVYSLCFTIYGAGLQTGVSQIVSHQDKKDHPGIIKTGIISSLFVSITLSCIVFIFREQIASDLLSAKDTAPLLMILSFIFPICGITALTNGYFYGVNCAAVPAKTQIMEQLFRVSFVFLTCTFYILPCSYMSLAVMGLLVGELASNIYNISKLTHYISIRRILHSRTSFSKLISMSLPLSGTKLVVALLGSIESILIPPLLCGYGYSEKDSLALYGILTGIVLPFLLFPGTITNSMSVLLLPTISHAAGKSKKRDVIITSSLTIKYSLLLGVVACGIFINFGTDIGEYIFHSVNAGKLLTLMSFICPFLYVTTTLSSIINGLGKTKVTFGITVIGLLIRIGCLYTLAPKYGIFGYIFGLLSSQIIICLLHGIYLLNKINISWHAGRYIIWPFIFSTSLYFITHIAGKWLTDITGIPMISLLLLLPSSALVILYLYRAGLISTKDIQTPV